MKTKIVQQFAEERLTGDGNKSLQELESQKYEKDTLLVKKYSELSINRVPLQEVTNKMGPLEQESTPNLLPLPNEANDVKDDEPKAASLSESMTSLNQQMNNSSFPELELA